MTDWVNTTCPCGGLAKRDGIPCLSGPASAGTSCAICIPTIRTRFGLAGSPEHRAPVDCGQRRYGAHHPAFAVPPASGTSSCMTLAYKPTGWCRTKSVLPWWRSWVKRREDEQVPRQCGQPGRDRGSVSNT